MIRDIDNNELQRLASHLRACGRDPSSFSAVLQPDGLVRVSGPRGTAFYPRAQWFDRFTRHLDKAFFDPAVPAPSGPRLDRKRPAMVPAA